MECSFCIWLARNKACSTKEIVLSLKTPEDPLVYQNPPSTPSKANSLKINSLFQLALWIKGTLVTEMPSCRHWVSYHHSGIEYHQSHHLYLHFLNQLLWTWKKNPDLTNQLIHQIFYQLSLARSQISESCHTPFNFNSQQDAAEVLQFVTDKLKLKGASVAASDLISNTIRINVSCNQCFWFSAKEEKLDMSRDNKSASRNDKLDLDV